jgi:hypothetical protein
MSRNVTAALAVLVLVAGVGVGVGVGAMVQGSSGQVAAVASASPDPLVTEPTGSAPEPTETGESTGAPGTEAPAPPTDSPTPAPTATPEPTPVTYPDPLTGLPVSRQLASRRVVAVMIDDLSVARPQSGLSAASVVYQAPAEGGIPRYMAFFQAGDPPAVGPVRSSRLYFIAWASEWNAVYVHAGGSPQALALLNSSKGHGSVVYNADQFRWGNSYLWRIKTRFSPHNVYTDGKNLRKLAKKIGAKSYKSVPQPAWTFAADAPLEARPDGGTITVPYLANRVTYKYDRKTNTYLRSVSVEGKQKDAGTKKRIAPKNVVVMQVVFSATGDKKHRLDGQVTGSGKAWIFTNGQVVKGTWKKKSFSSPTRFFDKDGNPITLTAGQTFVQVIPRSITLKYTKGKVPVVSPIPSASASPSTQP